MAKFDKNTIATLIQLSRIECSEEEKEELYLNLQKILDYIDQLNEINTDGIPPRNQILADLYNVVRDDVVGTTLPRELFLANAPSQIGGMIRVPPVIKSS